LRRGWAVSFSHGRGGSDARSSPPFLNPMTTILCALLWILFPLLLLIVLLERLTETQPQQIRRLRRDGLSQQAIAHKLSISRYKVRQALA
jgi:hypothetical protein